MIRDYYAVLGIGVAATPTQIRRAYQQLARRYSPDVNLWDREAQSLFEEISQAYRVLSDPSARQLYDRQPAPQPRERRAAGERSGRRGDDLHVPVALTLAQAYTGLMLDLQVDRLSPCVACEATGARPGARAAACGHCAGTGTIWRRDGAVASPEPCPACDGSGQRVTEPCAACRGRGVQSTHAVVPAWIPPGIDTGGQVRVPGEGHAGPFGGARGDLVVLTSVQVDPVFTRKGDNLHCDLPVSVVEVLLGARVPLATPAGPIDLVVLPGTQSGQMVRVRGKGMPRLTGEGKGDLYVTAQVEIPRDLDVRTQEMVRALGRLLPGPRGGAPRRSVQT